MTVVTRFAPSPTGFLHIGGARTALFNWLFARHHGGQFRLRIEDTDLKRSTAAAKAAILDGLQWLELDWDGEVIYQSARRAAHVATVQRLLDSGHAYRCYCSPEELADMRDQARAEGRPVMYDGRWRDRSPDEAPAGVAPAIRLKAPRDGESVIDDLVQGTVRIANSQLDDMILLRADGTPTYMLAVVVDDHDMGVTHTIRGDDHLNNAFRQTQIFEALDWNPPEFAHIPLIHGPDGAKLSKRHGALGVDAYRDMGYLPAAMRNYLLRLGWSHGDDEVISTEQAIQWFDLGGVGKSASRFDFTKLESLNATYIRDSADDALLGLLMPLVEKRVGHQIDASASARLVAGLGGLKPRAKTLLELADNAEFYVADRPIVIADKAAILLDQDGRANLDALSSELAALPDWLPESIESAVRAFAESQGLKLGKIAQPLRAALTGSTTSPGMWEVMFALGRNEVLGRLGDVSAPA